MAILVRFYRSNSEDEREDRCACHVPETDLGISRAGRSETRQIEGLRQSLVIGAGARSSSPSDNRAAKNLRLFPAGVAAGKTMNNREESVSKMKNCRCNASVCILYALWSLSDWAEGTLDNVHRELTRELRPLDRPTNEWYLKVLKRFWGDCRAGISAIKNTRCACPEIVNLYSKVDAIHEAAGNVRVHPWYQDTAGEQFIPGLTALVQEMLLGARNCKLETVRVMDQGSPQN